MSVDAVSAVLRGASFVALFQAIGAAIFLAWLNPSDRRESILQLIRVSALVGIIALTLQYVSEAARMSGDFAGIIDWELQGLVAHSSLLAILLVRVIVLALLMSAPLARMRWIAVVCLLLVSVSFALTGHARAQPYNPALSILLLVHVAVVAFWFGSLVPLLMLNRSRARDIVSLVERFSRIAIRVVPLLFIAGASLIAGLFYSPRNFLEPYGALLIGKMLAFSVLMGLAAFNRWKLGPKLQSSRTATRHFERALITEYVLIGGVLFATAFLTAFYSPSRL